MAIEPSVTQDGSMMSTLGKEEYEYLHQEDNEGGWTMRE